MCEGHANHGANTWGRPGGMGQEGRRDRPTHTAAQLANEGLARCANGAKDADRYDYETHALRQGAILSHTAAAGHG